MNFFHFEIFSVWKGRWKELDVAIKEYHEYDGESSLIDFQREVAVMR